MPRVLVVDDSQVSRHLLAHILAGDPHIVVVGEAANGEEAVALTARLRPDVIAMDIQMPIMDGFEATRRIMSSTPTPIVMVSAVHKPDEVAWSFRAIEAGALTVLAKPDGPNSPLHESQAADLITAVKELSLVRVITRRPASERQQRAHRRDGMPRAEIKVVAIGASTGGPAALAKIASGLAPGFPAPVAVVQHIGRGFDRGLVDWLDGVARVRVVMAAQGQVLEPGTIYIGPHDRHFGISSNGRVVLSDGPPVGGHRPSATHLFRSVAAAYGPEGLGVILTGIGNDGCEGLRSLRQAGGMVLAQDKESCVVYGMPKAVVDAGLADRILPVESVAAVLGTMVTRAQPTAAAGR